MKKQVLILMTFVISSMSYSQTFTDNFITYNVTSTTNHTVEITGYTGSNGVSVTIPDSVINNNTSYTITSIGDFAFVNKSLTSISIGSNVENIGMFAFNNNQLSTLTIPASVLTLGMQSFSFNPLTCVISEATTPPVIVTGGINDSFGESRSNINLTIPSGTASDYATATWTGFNNVAEGLTGNFTVNHITYTVTSTTNNTVKTTNYNTTGGTMVDIPTTVSRGCETYSITEIGSFSFQSKGLTAVTIPNTIVNIGEKAFFINNLTTLTIPDSVINIDEGAFAQNQNMTTLVLGNNLTTIGDFAFRFCALNDIIIPASVTNIGVIAFGGMGGINAITDIYCLGVVPPTITTSGSINTDTFNQARSTIHLHIPAGTLGAYVTDSGALWTGFNPVTEDALSTSNFELENDIQFITTENSIKILTDNGLLVNRYTVYNLSGQEITSGTETAIDSSTFSKGIYIISLNFNEGTVVKKVLVH